MESELPTTDDSFDLIGNLYKKLTVSGLKSSFHGDIFQLGLLTLSAIRAKNSAKRFYLIAEAKEFEKFDDLVIDFVDHITLLQAKHSEKTDYFVKNDFLSEKGDASLAKYYDSWSAIRQLPFLKLPDGKRKDTKFIFFSNKKLKKMDKYIEEKQIENDEFAFSSAFATPSYRIIKGKKRSEFIEAIKKHSKITNKENPKEKITNYFIGTKKSAAVNNNTDIEEFLDQFIIKTNQPNVDQLFEIVKHEIGSQVNIGVQETYTRVIQFMLEWFKDMKTCVLTSKNFEDLNILQNADMSRFFFYHLTKKFEEEFNDHLLDFQGFTNEKLLDFLTAQNPPEQNVQIIIGSNLRPIVYITIKELKNLKQDEWIYIDYNDKIRDIEVIFQSSVVKFVVINTQNIDVFTQQQIQNIGNILKNIGSMKVIILTKTKLDISEYLSKTFQENLLEPPSDEQIQILYNKYENKYITLAGKEYKIKDIINQRLGSIYEIMKNIQYFPQITEHAHDYQVPVESGMPYGIYIENEMSYGKGYYDLSIIMRKKVSYYIISGVNYNNLFKRIKNLFQENPEKFAEIENVETDFEKWEISDFFLLKDPNLVFYLESFDLNSDNNNCSKVYILTAKPANFNKTNYLLLKPVKSSSTKKFEVAENPSNVYLPFAQGVDYSSRESQEKFIKDISTGGQLSILLAPAGYGKTSFCKNIINNHKKYEDASNPVWVVYIPLPLLQFDNQCQPNFEPFLNIHYNWENEAFQADKHIKGMVLLILDSFDEVKDVRIIDKINEFIQKKLNEFQTSCLITTRPYATNKLLLPSERLAIYKLTKYTEKQQKEYIKKYVTAILKNFKPSENVLNAFVKEVECFLTTGLNKNSSKILGIPLESFLTCELLQPHILNYIVKNDNQVPEKCQINFKYLDISNTATLYQEFIRSKSILFLEKHIGVNSEKVYDKSMTFNLMGAYNQIMELYALKQSFSIKNITKYTKTINFEIRTFKTLEDTGLLKVAKDKDGRKLYFNHETYQEFYSALAIIRGLLSGKGHLFKLVKKIVVKNCYNPKFQFIFTIIAQFSFVGGPMIPGYEKKNNLFSYWDVFGKNFDVLGAGAVRVFSCFFEEFIEEKIEQNEIKKQLQKQFKYFQNNTKESKWAKYIKYALSVSQPKNYLKVNKDDDDGNELPIVNYINDDSVDKKNLNQIFNSISQEFRYKKKNNLLVKKDIYLLEKETKMHSGKYDYWALDEGIEAIGYTGKLFSKPLADFLIERSKFWNNNRKAAVLALREIYKSLTDKDDIAKKNCFYVLQTINLSAEYNNAMQSLLQQVNQEFIRYLIMGLSSEWQVLINDNFMKENPLIKYNKLQTIKNILFVAEKLLYAVIVRDNHLFLVKEKEIEIKFGKGYLNKCFANEVFEFIKKINSFEEYSPGCWIDSFVLKKFDESLVSFKQKIENLNLKNDDEFINLLNKQGHYKSYTCTLYAHLFVNKLLNKHHVEGLVRLWENSDSSHSSNWVESAGIISIGYTGQYFNMQLATYLCEVEDSYKNINQARAALKQIFLTLTSDDIDHNKAYHEAVKAFNYCAKKFCFKEIQLIQQSFGKRKLTDI
ncbi:uncharacterized protein LOC124816475 [Hydra vulgaris]|uniref:uncharacterized protein LOC124816475 n=1 Tax=Hydra vulgaris TaxID=6087 RepID=UPI001F5F3159|nr:uncharacterized protein LOC124816475 [Hydra vulgaris]XP_047141841.1 uncharacterized protein LOC124816475 [Hydra vulgaris]